MTTSIPVRILFAEQDGCPTTDIILAEPRVFVKGFLRFFRKKEKKFFRWDKEFQKQCVASGRLIICNQKCIIKAYN